MKTDPQTVNRFLTEARNCAMQMMENACFIQKELPSLVMPDSLRQQIDKLCNDLIGTKHDLINETFEVGDLIESSPDSPAITEKIEQMHQWIFMDTMRFHECVQNVEQAVALGNADGSLSLLLMESGVNILTAVPSAPESEGTDSEFETDATEEEDQEEEDDDDPNCYAFYSEDSYPVSILIAAIRRLMTRTELSAKTIGELKVFLFAMQRLPLVTPGVRMSVGLRLDQGGESDWIEIRMEDGEFSLSRGSWIEGDADTETVFEVTSEYRDGDAFIATGFAESFTECARDVCREIVIDDTSDEPFTDWDLEQDKKRWASLPCSFL